MLKDGCVFNYTKRNAKLTYTSFIYAVIDFEGCSETALFNVGDTVGERRCVGVDILSDGEMEGPEVFLVLIFIATMDANVEIDFDRRLKNVTIFDGEYSTSISYTTK